MAAQFKIDQATLSAGTNGRARTDGLAGGQLVTLTSVGAGGSTFLFELLWKPPLDTTAVSTLAVTGNPLIWTFTPTAGVYGTYRIRLTVDRGLSTESTSTRVFVIRTPRKGLVIPGLSERASPTASLVNAGAAAIDASENNENTGGAVGSLDYSGWWRGLYELINVVDGLDNPTVIEAVVTSGSSNHNWNPTGWDTADIVLLTTDVTGLTLYLSGLMAPTATGKARKRLIARDLIDPLYIYNEAGGSTATNRIKTPFAGSVLLRPVNASTPGFESVDVVYSDVVGRWMLDAGNSASKHRLQLAGYMDANTQNIQSAGTIWHYQEYDYGNSGASIAISFASQQIGKVTLTGNAAITFSFPGVGNYTLRIIQDATGSRAPTFAVSGGSVQAALGNIDIKGAANSVTVMSLRYDGTNVQVATEPGVSNVTTVTLV